jgi:hypothetical protein
VGISPSDCTILQISDRMFGQYAFDVGGILSNRTAAAMSAALRFDNNSGTDDDTAAVATAAAGPDDDGGGGATGMSFGPLFGNATFAGAMDWFGLEYQERVPYTASAVGASGTETALSARMSYRKGSLVEAFTNAQPWDKLIIGIPVRQCAEAERSCLADPTCAAIANSVADPTSPTLLETARCELNDLCATSLAVCNAPHPNESGPLSLTTRFRFDGASHESATVDSVLVTASYVQTELTSIVQSLLDEVGPLYSGTNSEALDLWQISMRAKPLPPTGTSTVLGRALGVHVNLITPPDIDTWLVGVYDTFFAPVVNAEEAAVQNDVRYSQGRRRSQAAAAVVRPTATLLPRKQGDDDQTLRMRIRWIGPSEPERQLRFYPTNKVALTFYFDNATHYDLTVPPPHGATQRTSTVEFQGSMLITQAWTFDVTLFNGPALEHAGTESITFVRRDGGAAFGFDISLDDGAVVMPLDLVLPRLPYTCLNGGLGGIPDATTGGGPPARAPPPSPPPPPVPLPEPVDPVTPAPAPAIAEDLRVVTNVVTDGSLTDGEGTVTMEMSNPFGIGYGIINVIASVVKVTHSWDTNARVARDHHMSLGPPAHMLNCAGLSPGTSCLYVPAHCPASSDCGRVPISISARMTADYSEVRDTQSLELSIPVGSQSTIRIGDVAANNYIDYTLHFAVNDLLGVRCHGLLTGGGN